MPRSGRRSRTRSAPVHGTCVAVGRSGVLIRGRSGSGKSDLALRLIADGARLVADDQVLIENTSGRLVARAPKTIRGLMEVRGVGLVRVPTVPSARLALVVDLVPSRSVPRLPEPRCERIAGAQVPLVALASFEASAVVKVRLALRFGGGSTEPPRAARRRPVSPRSTLVRSTRNPSS